MTNLTVLTSLSKPIDGVFDHLQAPLLLAIRGFWGYQFALTGWGKLNNLEGVTGYFESLGIPFAGFNATLVGGTEFIGGLMLLLGLAARPAAIPLVITMVVAYFTADAHALSVIWSDPDTFIAATPFLFLLASSIVLAFGPGAWSVDALIAKAAAAPEDQTASQPATA